MIVKVLWKGKFVLRAMKESEGVQGLLHLFLTSVLDGSE